jgi:hypothetical protein
MKKGLYILSFLLLWSTMLFAQVKFTANAGRTEVGTGEQFEVDFTVNSNASDFNPPSFEGFQVLSGPNQSQSMMDNNGVVTVTNGFSYILAATKVGTFIIGPATINAGGKVLRSNPIRLKVVKGQAAQQNNQQGQVPGQQEVSEGNTSDVSKLIFMRAEVDKTHVYQGEQITLNYKLYTKVGILGRTGEDKAPDLNGFWNQDVLVKGKPPEPTIETYKGQRYNVIILKQTILYPEHSGDLTIDSYALSLAIRIQQRGSGDIFEQMFGGGTKDIKYKVVSPPVTIHVMPLPEAGKPIGYSGAVGSFTVESKVDKNELKANETLNYNIKITGKGNLALINAPVINPPADFEKYDPKVTDNITVSATGVSGSRAYGYLLIPRHQGDFTFSPPAFSYFNPATKQYVTLPAKSFAIKVNKGDAETNVTALNSSVNQQDIKTLGKDIRYIKTSSPDMYKDGEGFYGSAGFYLLLLLGPLAFAGALFYRKWQIEQNSDLVKLKSRKANKIANKHLAVAAKQLAAGDKKAFYEAIARGLYGYLSDKLNIPVADLNKENITSQLKAKQLDSGTLNQLVDTMDLCEMARFAPVTGISEQQVFDKAKLTINEIEEKI